MKKNILFIIESSETGGAESVFAELVLRVDRERYIPHVALLYEGWLLDKLVAVGVTPHLISTRKGGFDFGLLQGIGKLIKRHDIDLIHSHLFTTSVYSSVIGALSGVPVVSTLHGTMDVAEQDLLKKLKWKAINRFSRRVVFVSNYLRDYFVDQRLACSAKSLVVHNGIDIDRLRQGLSKPEARERIGLSDKSFVIGCVGDLRPAKDYQTALRAVAVLKPVIADLKLLIVGTKTDLFPGLEELRDCLGLRLQVEFLGFRPDIENIFPAFDVYLTTSTSEGFSLTVVEAMAIGLPVVATRSGGPEEIIRSGETGLLVEIGVPEKIASAIAAIYRNKALADKLSRAGVHLAETDFSVQTMVDGYQAIYQSITDHRSGVEHG